MSNPKKAFEIAVGPPPDSDESPTPIYSTALGSAYYGDSLNVLRSAPFQRRAGRVQLVFTSPPFPLNTKKRYGNLQGEAYAEWFAGFAPVLRDLVANDGSIVVEIGNAWEPKRPVMSTLVLRSLLRFADPMGKCRTDSCERCIYPYLVDVTIGPPKG
jgi:hypothetical protein